MLPQFWRALSQALPNGAGTDAVRQIVYFQGARIGLDLTVIAGYAAGGLLVTLAASLLRARQPRSRMPAVPAVR